MALYIVEKILLVMFLKQNDGKRLRELFPTCWHDIIIHDCRMRYDAIHRLLLVNGDQSLFLFVFCSCTMLMCTSQYQTRSLLQRKNFC